MDSILLPTQSRLHASGHPSHGRIADGILPSGTNEQCCGSNCISKYCLIGLSSKGCDGNQPYINCIGG